LPTPKQRRTELKANFTPRSKPQLKADVISCSTTLKADVIPHSISKLKGGAIPRTIPKPRVNFIPRSIPKFSATLKEGEFRAVDVVRDQIGFEGPFWLCLLRGNAFKSSSSLVLEKECFEKGFHLVKVQWLKLIEIDDQSRIYRLSDDEQLISAHSLVRHPPIELVLRHTGKRRQTKTYRLMHRLSEEIKKCTAIQRKLRISTERNST
jgi:hypothetical protein